MLKAAMEVLHVGRVTEGCREGRAREGGGGGEGEDNGHDEDEYEEHVQPCSHCRTLGAPTEHTVGRCVMGHWGCVQRVPSSPTPDLVGLEVSAQIYCPQASLQDRRRAA